MSIPSHMVQTHPGGATGAHVRAEAIKALLDCAQACTACADACLNVPEVAELATCVARCLDCADLCGATWRIASRQTGSEARLLRAGLEACVAACQLCAAECADHAQHHEPCRVCAEACRRAERACGELLHQLAP